MPLFQVAIFPFQIPSLPAFAAQLAGQVFEDQVSRAEAASLAMGSPA